MNHWPSGVRDTTEFPQVQIEVDSSFRAHLEAFCKLEGVGWTNYEMQKQVSGLDVEPQRLRTYRKFYQNFGVIFKKDDTIRLSTLGQSLKSLMGTLVKARDEELQRIASIAIDMLARYQLDNPTESQRAELPSNCDVLPCICIWKAMLSLDNKIHHEEMNRVLLRVLNMNDLDSAITKISSIRQSSFPYGEKSDTELTDLLGEPVHTNQPPARIAPWFSFAGWGGLIIDRNVDSDGFRNLDPKIIPLIKRAVNKPIRYFKTDDEEEWYEYFLGSAAAASETFDIGSPQIDFTQIVDEFSTDITKASLSFNEDLLLRFVTSCLTKKFVILTGLSGSGKTKLAHAFASWISPKTQKKDPFLPGAKIKSDRVTYYVKNSDYLSVEFSNSLDFEDATFVTLPRAVISEWANYVVANNLPRDTSARHIREGVSPHSKFSSQLHSFETHLKAAAFAQIDSKEIQSHEDCYKVVPVGADWTTNENVLGYQDALQPDIYRKPPSGALDIVLKAVRNPQVPYFLILDEMNLSHVERYFADILSAIESGEEISLHSNSNLLKANEEDHILVPPKTKIPQNLFIIGTVNIDETTFMFSPKVLDRANVVEFRASSEQINSFLTSPMRVNMDLIRGKGAKYGRELLEVSYTEAPLKELSPNIADGAQVSEELKSKLTELFDSLAPIGAEFGFRTAMEVSRFIYFHAYLSGPGWQFSRALDAQVIQKLMPKLHGSDRKLRPTLEVLRQFCEENELPLSLEKTDRMLKRLSQDGFTSFAEA